jgi:hypothetical protein
LYDGVQGGEDSGKTSWSARNVLTSWTMNSSRSQKPDREETFCDGRSRAASTRGPPRTVPDHKRHRGPDD